MARKAGGISMNAYRTLAQILLVCACGAAVAACGSSSTTSVAGAAATASSPNSAAQSQIKAGWTAFFSAKTSVAKRVSLLQDGPAFASVIKSQASSNPFPGASAEVTKVTMMSATKAKVRYSILLAGQPVLPNQTGVAVYQGGTWKVGATSFCGLLIIEGGGKASSLPAACKAGG